MDWGAWSRESVSLMATRTRHLLASVEMGSDYAWDLDAAAMAMDGATFRLVTVGTVAGDSFLWAGANDSIPERAKVGIDRVREFGVENDLGLLSEPCAAGGLSQGKECLAIAGRVLDAHGTWIDETDAGFILFVLYAPNRD
jgi:hypothetical protein